MESSLWARHESHTDQGQCSLISSLRNLKGGFAGVSVPLRQTLSHTDTVIPCECVHVHTHCTITGRGLVMDN